MDLTTTYLGLSLKNPLVASSSPLTGDFDSLRRLEDAGAASVVLPSLFEEQIEIEAGELERLTGAGDYITSEASSYFPPTAGYATGPESYLELIRRARDALAIPVIASLNGVTDRGWIDYARLIEQAGASALELNTFFVPIETWADGRAVEQRHVDVLRAVKSATTLPVAVKLAPYFSAVGDMVHQLQRAGAAGVVLFNRFYQPDVDLQAMQLRRDLSLSTPAEIRLPLLWIGVLAGHAELSIAAASGVQGGEEAVKFLLAGADVVMTTSALLRHGAAHMRIILKELKEWLEDRELQSVGDIRGTLSRRRLGDPAAFERANYITILQSWRGGRR